MPNKIQIEFQLYVNSLLIMMLMMLNFIISNSIPFHCLWWWNIVCSWSPCWWFWFVLAQDMSNAIVIQFESMVYEHLALSLHYDVDDDCCFQSNILCTLYFFMLFIMIMVVFYLYQKWEHQNTRKTNKYTTTSNTTKQQHSWINVCSWWWWWW